MRFSMKITFYIAERKKEGNRDMKNKIPGRKRDWRKISGTILLVTLVLSIVYSIYKIITFSSGTNTADPYEHFKSDYVLMLVECLLGLVVMFLPAFLEKHWVIRIPNGMTIAYFVFLYCAVYLGEVRNFYYAVPHWDSVLHAFSGGMLGALGFSLVNILNESERTKVSLSPVFVAIFAFSFALSMGALWEIYEYSLDCILGLNMQKFRLEDGTQLIGSAALADTMKDIIIDALSALAVSLAGCFGLKKGKGINKIKTNI